MTGLAVGGRLQDFKGRGGGGPYPVTPPRRAWALTWSSIVPHPLFKGIYYINFRGRRPGPPVGLLQRRGPEGQNQAFERREKTAAGKQITEDKNTKRRKKLPGGPTSPMARPTARGTAPMALPTTAMARPTARSTAPLALPTARDTARMHLPTAPSIAPMPRIIGNTTPRQVAATAREIPRPMGFRQ